MAKSAAIHRGGRKAIRDLLQSVAAIAAAGGATALIDLITGSVKPELGVVLAFVFKVLFAFLQNSLETAGKIPVVLPTPGIVPSAGGVVAKATGVVETTVEEVNGVVGDVTGVVTDLAGGLLGEVIPPGGDD